MMLYSLLLGAALAFSGYGCRQDGDLEVCMTQVTSVSLKGIFPDRVVDATAPEWRRYMVSIRTADEDVAAFLVRIIYTTDGLEPEEQIALVVRGANGGNAYWTNAVFFAPLDSAFKSVTVLPLKPTRRWTLDAGVNQ
jgi:hypothetical protein